MTRARTVVPVLVGTIATRLVCVAAVLGFVVLPSAAAGSTVQRASTVVRVYDIRITSQTRETMTETFDECSKIAKATATHTWSRVFRGVRFAFTPHPPGQRFRNTISLMEHVKRGLGTGVVLYNDNGMGCGVPSCEWVGQFPRSHTFYVEYGPSRYQSASTGPYQFTLRAQPSTAPRGPGNFCGGYGDDRVAYGGAIDRTRGGGSSWQRIADSWSDHFSMNVFSRWAPTAAKLPFPIDQLYKGNRVRLRVSDFSDETGLFSSFTGTLTIVFEPRR